MILPGSKKAYRSLKTIGADAGVSGVKLPAQHRKAWTAYVKLESAHARDEESDEVKLSKHLVAGPVILPRPNGRFGSRRNDHRRLLTTP